MENQFSYDKKPLLLIIEAPSPSHTFNLDNIEVIVNSSHRKLNSILPTFLGSNAEGSFTMRIFLNRIRTIIF